MFCWQITKYDPQNRDENNRYLKDEWTEYSDIGKVFEGKKLTYKDYVKVEKIYIKAVLLFMECAHLDALKVIYLEKNGKRPKSIVVDGIKIKNNNYYPKKMIVFIIQSILRCKFWCILETENMRVKFDYDYYMTIGCTIYCSKAIEKIQEMGLFVKTDKLEYLFEQVEDSNESLEDNSAVPTKLSPIDIN
jgi:hypothetical protein